MRCLRSLSVLFWFRTFKCALHTFAMLFIHRLQTPFNFCMKTLEFTRIPPYVKISKPHIGWSSPLTKNNLTFAFIDFTLEQWRRLEAKSHEVHPWFYGFKMSPLLFIALRSSWSLAILPWSFAHMLLFSRQLSRFLVIFVNMTMTRFVTYYFRQLEFPISWILEYFCKTHFVLRWEIDKFHSNPKHLGVFI